MIWQSLFVLSLLICACFATLEVRAAAFGLDDFGGNFYGSNLDDDAFEIFDLVNKERRRKGLSDLDWNHNLAKMARDYSRKMARENFFAHYDTNGGSVVERADKAQISRWTKIGENLFSCFNMSDYNESAVRGWLKSSSHKRNMLDRDWTDSGIGVAKSREGKIYVTQVFIRR